MKKYERNKIVKKSDINLGKDQKNAIEKNGDINVENDQRTTLQKMARSALKRIKESFCEKWRYQYGKKSKRYSENKEINMETNQRNETAKSTWKRMIVRRLRKKSISN